MIRFLSTLLTLTLCLPASSQDPLIIAHRGASRDAPENTIPAFKLAWEQGADAIEGDFHKTRDGEIVCIHDKHTRKVSDQDFTVKKSSLESLRALDVGAYHSPQYEGAKIPTIAEVFATVPKGKKIFVEVKSDRSIVPKLLDEIDQSGLEPDQIIIISFDKRVIHSLKSRTPQYKAYWLLSPKQKKPGVTTPSTKSILKTLNRISADGFSSNQKTTRKPLVDAIQQNNYEYHVWTVDDHATAQKFKSWGALSLTTNIPGLLRSQLDETNFKQ